MNGRRSPTARGHRQHLPERKSEAVISSPAFPSAAEGGASAPRLELPQHCGTTAPHRGQGGSQDPTQELLPEEGKQSRASIHFVDLNQQLSAEFLLWGLFPSLLHLRPVSMGALDVEPVRSFKGTRH